VISPSDQLAVGIDFGGTKMLGALVDREGRVLTDHSVPTPYDDRELLDAIRSLVTTLEEKSGVCSIGVGVGAAGLVGRDGVLYFGPNVGRVNNVAIRSRLAEMLPGRIIQVENDNTCATWAECLFGAGRGVREMVFVGLGTGIGTGNVVEGRLARGQHGFAAEGGHMTVAAHGIDCVCGKRGCWEAYASGRAVGRMGREAAAAGKAPRILELAGSIDDIRGEHVTRAAREGDAGAKEVMDQLAWWLGLGITNLIAVLDPERVVIGGGMSGDADLYLDATHKFIDEMLFGAEHRPKVPVVAAELGAHAGAIGAAMLIYGDDLGSISA
jgi:glucokinase